MSIQKKLALVGDCQGSSKKRRFTRNVSVAASLALFLGLFSALTEHPGVSATTTAGNGTCRQTVDDATGVQVSEITESNVRYCVMQFTKVGTTTWTVPSDVTAVDYLVVAGGGGGAPSGGGGAGGLLESTAASITAGSTQTITVGDGGSGAAGLNNPPTNGENSSFLGVTAIGGGAAGANAYNPEGIGRDGGSGGGGGAANASPTNTGGAGTAGQGNPGGSNAFASPYPGGGGGGAGGAGGDASGSTGGAGGLGLSRSITGTSVGYAGGGAGTTFSTTTGSAGESQASFGGGEGASATVNGGNGVDGRGGGGGGAKNGGRGGDGGSGIVIVRFQLTDVTVIYTDFGGYWKSDATNTPTDVPNADHNLLAFTFRGVVYSTGVNDATLTSRGVTFTAGNWEALPVEGLSTTASTNYFAVRGGSINSPGFTNPSSASDLSALLTDGTNGLNLGSGLTNIPQGTSVTFKIPDGLQSAALNDGLPDLLVTQIASPSSTADTLQFRDQNNQLLGQSVSINQQAIATVTRPNSARSLASNYFVVPTGALASGFTFPVPSDVRMRAYELADFGLRPNQLADVRSLVWSPSGTSDPAFFAYNTASLSAVSNSTVIGSATTTLSAIPNTNLSVGTLTAQATNSQNLTVTFGSTTTSVCTVNQSTGVVTLVSQGTCSVTATQARTQVGNTLYPASSASTSFTVLPTTQSETSTESNRRDRNESPSPSTTPTPTPARLPLATPPRSNTLPPPASPGPIIRGQQFSPPANPLATVNGVPTPTTTQSLGNTGVRVTTGSVDVGVRVASENQGRVTQNSSGAPELSVVRNQSTILSGQGVLPGSVVQVFMGFGQQSAELARIPVGPDGTFNGQAALQTPGSNAPLPIGRHVLQVVSVDARGNQTVVDMPINVAQPSPQPEVVLANGQTPSLTPGQTLATRAGEPVSVNIIPRSDIRQTIIEGEDWTMSITAQGDQSKVVQRDDGSVVVEFIRDQAAEVSGSGFMPLTRADVWLFSEPTLLGTVDIDENGEFNGTVNVDGRIVQVGEHTLQLQGVGEDGYVRSANLGVVVNDAEGANATTESVSLAWLWWLLIAVCLVVVVAVLWYRRRQRGAA